MYPPYKRTLTPADRVIFEKWLWGIATFYGALALLFVLTIAIGHTIGGYTQGEVAALNMSSPSSPRSNAVPSSTSLGPVLLQQRP
jgi:hypothetical protein